MRFIYFAAATLCFHLLSMLLTAQDTQFPALDQQIPAPACLVMQGEGEPVSDACSIETHRAWLRDIQHWRDERRLRVGYVDDLYTLPELRWTQSSFIQTQMMVEDRYFYDPATGKYTVDRFLDDLMDRYGGVDAVLIWPTYPNMGIDNRNQLDLIEAMPGGLDGVRKVIADFHRRGVRVLFPMMMWDQGTNQPSQPWPEAFAEMMKDVGADGINGDTQDGIPRSFSDAAIKLGHPLAFEPELSPHDEALAWNELTWGQYQFSFEPKVDRFKWLEPRHMVNISDRWNRNKTDDLQFAFFNGVGWESWENIWGIWNGITPRDAELTRQMATLERGVAPYLSSKDWEPFYPTSVYGVFASRWPLGANTVWTLINRNEYDVDGPELSVPAQPGIHYYDLYRGTPLAPAQMGDRDYLSFPISSHGIEAIAAIAGDPDPAMLSLMLKMKRLTSGPHTNFADTWTPLKQTLVDQDRITSSRPSPDMVMVPGNDFLFSVKGIEIEGGDDAGVDVQYPWEDSPRRFHQHELHIKSFLIDKYPVTNTDFAMFMQATHYKPADDSNFLRDWKDGSFPTGWANKPVTWVSIEDARAYAKWAGKRLPHEWEWQYAAQGTDNRVYPWGNVWEAENVPVPDKGRTLRGPDDVSAHSSAESPFGIVDMVGNVWQWTDEYQDEHTRAAIIRGGSYYQPQGSKWYFPQAYENGEHGKLLLMSPSMDRAATIGFRCVRDSE